MVNKHLIFSFMFLLVGCSEPVKVSPDKLPDAYLNQPYETAIEITGGMVVELSFYSEVSDENFEIVANTSNEGYIDYNDLTVSGTPTTLQPIYINLVGGTYGTNFPGGSFEKRYIIQVKAN